MKKIYFYLPLFVFALCVPAFAHKLDIGGVGINFETPQGYIAAMDGSYGDMLSITRQAMPKEVTVHALFVPAKVDDEFRKGGRWLSSYLLVTSTAQLDDVLLSREDFSAYKDFLIKNNGRLELEGLRTRLDEALWKSEERAKTGQILSLGCFADNEYSIALMALLTQLVITDGEHAVHDQVMIANSLVVQGKMVSVTQYRLVDMALEALDFQAASQDVVESMRFSLGGAAQSSGLFEAKKASKPQTAEGEGLDAVIAVALGMLALGGIYVFIRSRKRG